MLDFEAILEDIRLVRPGAVGFLVGDVGIGAGSVTLAQRPAGLASKGIEDIRRRVEASPSINFICSLSSELDSASSLSSSLMLS